MIVHKTQKYGILPVVGFIVTMAFELAPSGIYFDWFIGYDVSDKAGNPALSLRYYLDDIGNHINVALLWWYMCLNSANAWQRRMYGTMALLHVASVMNYLYNYHMPIIWQIDANFLIATYLVVVTVTKKS